MLAMTELLLDADQYTSRVRRPSSSAATHKETDESCSAKDVVVNVPHDRGQRGLHRPGDVEDVDCFVPHLLKAIKPAQRGGQ